MKFPRATYLICCFQYKDDAEKFYKRLVERLKEYGLEIAEEKTKVIEFGRFAEESRTKRGEGKPDTFDFLGFTHYCSKSSKGRFITRRKTSKKKYKAKLKKSKAWLRENMHEPVMKLLKRLNQKLVGHYRYYGVTGNYDMINSFKFRVTKQLYWALNRRSQRRDMSWDKLKQWMKKCPIAKPKTYVNFYG